MIPDPTSHAVSDTYKLLSRPVDSFVPPYLLKWEQDLGREFLAKNSVTILCTLLTTSPGQANTKNWGIKYLPNGTGFYSFWESSTLHRLILADVARRRKDQSCIYSGHVVS